MRKLAHLARSDEFARRAETRRNDGFESARNRRQGDIAFVSRPFALQQMNVQFPVQPEAQLHAKWSGRRFVLRGCWSAQEDRAFAGLCATSFGWDWLAQNVFARQEQPSAAKHFAFGALSAVVVAGAAFMLWGK